jgi:hypothetical protein
MITSKDIYAATHSGLDIILSYYPQAEGCIDNKKKFKRRPDEDDASAVLRLYGDCYKVTDFGDTATAMSPIDICMQEENLRFTEAVALLAARYGVTDELKHSVNKPEIRKRPARADEQEGSRSFELEEGFTAEQLKILGPRVKPEHVDALHWHVARSISYVKNREVTEKRTTPTYPIFMRECVVEEAREGQDAVRFFKVYEPLNPDKQWRFSYTPEGVKPKQYINGLAELKEAYRRFNAQEEAAFSKLPENEDKNYKEQKLEAAFLCSGERDALCVRALGYHPLWFNSETYRVSPEEIREIRRYVDVLYNIPDIDATGRRKGSELALQYMDIMTIWLPSWLMKYRDRRGKPRKDLRDFVELRPGTEDFRGLLNLAMPARFWEERMSSRTGKMSYEINTSYLHHFLNLNGFYTLRDPDSDTVRYIKLEGCVVQRILKVKEIAAWLKQFAVTRAMPVEIRNLILNSPRTSESSLSLLDEVDIDFTSYTPDGQYFYCNGSSWYITREGITEFKGIIPDGRMVWADNVIPHRVSILPPMFTWTMKPSITGEEEPVITVSPDAPSNLLKYLINTSRLYWRKELEEHWEGKDPAEAEAYRAAHRFCIDSPLLTPEEVNEQKQNLANKLFAIGYQLHRYKSPSRAWALYAMDNKIGEVDECNGRTGKSFLFKTFRHFMRTVSLSGRNPKLLDNPHVYDQVDRDTDFVLVDDCDRYLHTEWFYDNITSGMTVNPKNNRSFFIDFEQSPKFGFTTNYVPTDFDSSTNARLLYMVFSDYYHERTEANDYLESRSIRDDLGGDLLDGRYPEAAWNADINFYAQCLQFYLDMVGRGLKLQPPLDNIIRRKYKADMGDSFEDWALTYFAPESEHVNTFLQTQLVFTDFFLQSNVQRSYWTKNRFTKALKAFVRLHPEYVLNPESMQNTAHRIIRKVEGVAREMYYMQYTPVGQKPAAPEAVQSYLSF